MTRRKRRIIKVLNITERPWVQMGKGGSTQLPDRNYVLKLKIIKSTEKRKLHELTVLLKNITW